MRRYALALMTLMSLLASGCGILRSVEPGAAPEALELLVSATWPGNVRQLYNVIEQAQFKSPKP